MGWYLERSFVLSWFAVMLYFLIGYSLPYGFWINDRETTYHDMCLGSSEQFVQSDRTPVWSIQGHTNSQLIEFVNNRRIETDIFRQAEPIYQSGDFTEFHITWDKPITATGTYGAETAITIKPLPFIISRTVIPAEDRMFNVIECEHGNTN